MPTFGYASSCESFSLHPQFGRVLTRPFSFYFIFPGQVILDVSCPSILLQSIVLILRPVSEAYMIGDIDCSDLRAAMNVRLFFRLFWTWS